jgi:hypothetical protein
LDYPALIMSALILRNAQGVSCLANAEPLYRRVPTHAADGQPLSDFMMLIPGIREWPGARRIDRVAGLQAVLGGFSEVVFADLNLPLNLLWVSVRNTPGVILRLVAAIQARVPEAKVVGTQAG